MSDRRARRPESGPEHVNGFRPGRHRTVFACGHPAGVRLSHTEGAGGLPRHWTARMDADDAARIREKLELIRLLENMGCGGWFAIR